MNPQHTRRAVYASAFLLLAAIAACSSPTAVRDRTQFRLHPPMSDTGYKPPPPPPHPRVS